MPVVHSNESWEDYALHWPRMKREMLNVIDLGKSLFRRRQEDIPGANFFPVPFYNDSGETIPAYGVMRVSGVQTRGAVPVITVNKPSGTFQRLYLVNGPLPVSGSSSQEPNFGTWASEAAFVLYDDSNTPAYGEEWGPSNGSWEIKKYRYGFHILGGATGGDTDIVGVRQGIVSEFYGQTDGAHNKGSTGTISIFDGNNSDTTDNMASVQNRYGNVATTKKVTVRCHGGVWQIVSAECP
jgi:hypothetical protein